MNIRASLACGRATRTRPVVPLVRAALNTRGMRIGVAMAALPEVDTSPAAS